MLPTKKIKTETKQKQEKNNYKKESVGHMCVYGIPWYSFPDPNLPLSFRLSTSNPSESEIRHECRFSLPKTSIVIYHFKS